MRLFTAQCPQRLMIPLTRFWGTSSSRGPTLPWAAHSWLLCLSVSGKQLHHRQHGDSRPSLLIPQTYCSHDSWSAGQRGQLLWTLCNTDTSPMLPGTPLKWVKPSSHPFLTPSFSFVPDLTHLQVLFSQKAYMLQWFSCLNLYFFFFCL